MLAAVPVADKARRQELRNPTTLIVVAPPGLIGGTVAEKVAAAVGWDAVDLDTHVFGSAAKASSRLSATGSDAFVGEATAALAPLGAAVRGKVVSVASHYTMDHAAFDAFVRTSGGLVVYVDAGHCCPVAAAAPEDYAIVAADMLTDRKEIFAVHRRHMGRHYHMRIITESSHSLSAVSDLVMDELQRRLIPDHPKNPHNMFVPSRSPPPVVPADSAATTGLAAALGQSPSPAAGHSLSQVMLAGTAGKGLFVPRPGCIPAMSLGQLHRLASEEYVERAVALIERWIPHEDLGGPAGLRRSIKDAYRLHVSPSEVVPLRAITSTAAGHDNTSTAPGLFLLDLTDGPTASFKDMALQLTPRLIRAAITDSTDNGGVSMVVPEDSPHPEPIVFCATSGDTGSAALHGFRGAGIPALALFPAKGVSAVQRAQMVQLAAEGGSTVAMSVNDSDFDQCQSMVKRAFSDQEMRDELLAKGYSVTAANSINFARLLSQMVYHASAYLDAMSAGAASDTRPLNAVIPSGNFGNAMAAVYAREMGVPIGLILCASNANNILADFLPPPVPADQMAAGNYDISGRQLMRTSSPAIDILRASNVERLVYLLASRRPSAGQDAAAEAAAATSAAFAGLDDSNCYALSDALVTEMGMEGGLMLAGGWATEAEVSKTVQTVTAQTGVPIDTHTAVAMAVLRRVIAAPADTAPAKALRNNPTYVTLTAHFSKFPTDFAHAVMGEASGLAGANDVQLEDARQNFKVSSGGPGDTPGECLKSFAAATSSYPGAAEGTERYWRLHGGVGPLADLPASVWETAPKVDCDYTTIKESVVRLAATSSKHI